MIVINNLSRKEGLRLLEYLRANQAPGISLQSANHYRYFWDDTKTVTLRPTTEPVGEFPDLNDNTLEIQSNYWVDSTMISWLPEKYQTNH